MNILDTGKTKEEVKPIINKLGFTKSVAVDSRSYSGGLYIVWNEDEVLPWALIAITNKDRSVDRTTSSFVW